MEEEDKIFKLIDIRPGDSDDCDDCNAKEYYEYFIKGTNVKLGFRYIDVATNEEKYYCVVCEGFNHCYSYDSEAELFEHFEWLLLNKELIWGYN